MNKSQDTKLDSLQQCFVSWAGLPFTNYQIPPGGIIFFKTLISRKRKYVTKPMDHLPNFVRYLYSFLFASVRSSII